ncbi:alpha/beta fold hydrolase [Microbulbifer sp. JTAC008]|uniref:alpha/beta fold hydrolase n=1 Tax=unclassified Microbulbifer TaxID=2619833 RepID=UPI00403920A4
MVWIQRFAIFAISLFIGLSPAVAEEREENNFESCYLDGWSHALHCTKIPVGEGEAAVDLAIMIAPAVNDIGLEPLYLLAGGPGQAASFLTPILNALYKVNQSRAIVLVDRRGSGYSAAFDCGIDGEVHMDLEAVTDQFSTCYLENSSFAKTLHSRQAVDDLEEVRLQLRHKKIALWGGSWGTRTALLYQQWYPESLSVLILDAVAPIDSKVFLTAQAAEKALLKLEKDCSQDPVCSEFGDWRSDLDSLLRDWDGRASNFPDPHSGRTMETSVPRSFIQNLIRTALYTPETAAQLPYAISQAEEGNYLPLSGLVGLLSDDGSMSMGLTLSVACAEELNRTTEEELAADIRDSFLGDAFFEIFAEGCKVWPVSPITYEVPEERNHPVLIISGEADPITPHYYAEQSLGYLSELKQVVVPGGGHINSMRGCIPKLIDDFLKSPLASLDSDCIADIQRPPFMAGAFGPEIDKAVSSELLSSQGDNK